MSRDFQPILLLDLLADLLPDLNQVFCIAIVMVCIILITITIGSINYT